jgi:hypothetical protein
VTRTTPWCARENTVLKGQPDARDGKENRRQAAEILLNTLGERSIKIPCAVWYRKVAVVYSFPITSYSSTD